MFRPFVSELIPLSPSMAERSISTSGETNRVFMSGIRLWPPAIKAAEPPLRLRSREASSTLEGLT
jgi:hypothetical protein